MFLLYYRDFFEQICSDVQFISPPEEVGEFLLHLLKGGKSSLPMIISGMFSCEDVLFCVVTEHPDISNTPKANKNGITAMYLDFMLCTSTIFSDFFLTAFFREILCDKLASFLHPFTAYLSRLIPLVKRTPYVCRFIIRCHPCPLL